MVNNRMETLSMGSLPPSTEDRIFTSAKKAFPNNEEEELMADMPMLTGE